MEGGSFIQGVRFQGSGILFSWPYQALPGLTGLDGPEAVGALKHGNVEASERWSAGALERNCARVEFLDGLMFHVDLSRWSA